MLNVPRQQLGTGSLGGCLYAVGGSDGYSRLSTVERFSPDANRWMYVKSLNTSRSGVGVGVLGETMYAMGGYDGGSCLKTVERYDPLVDVWSHVAPTNITRSFSGWYIKKILIIIIIILFVSSKYSTHVQYSDIMRFMVYHNRRH